MNSMNKERMVPIVLTTLRVIGFAGAFAILLVCPGMGQVFAMFEPEKYKRRAYPSTVSAVINRLRDNKCIELTNKFGVPRYALTEKGRATLAKYELKFAIIDKPKKWDEKWRIVIFDVRETRRSCRDAIRDSLKKLGFRYLQDSVWLYPYKCSDIVELARTAYGVRHDAKYLVCERFYGDEKYLNHFNLPDKRRR